MIEVLSSLTKILQTLNWCLWIFCNISKLTFIFERTWKFNPEHIYLETSHTDFNENPFQIILFRGLIIYAKYI